MKWIRAYRSSFSAVVAVALVCCLSAVLLSPEAWGALGQWAGAFGTVLAVLVALRIARGKADSEAERRRVEKAEHDLAQARLVVAVLEWPSPEYEDYLAHRYGAPPLPKVGITNYSSTHVFNPRVEDFNHQNGGTVTWGIDTDSPFGSYEGPPAVLAAGEHDMVPVHLTFDPPITPDMYPIRTTVTIGFTDAEGRRWRRIGQGTPEQVRASDTFSRRGPDWYQADQ